MSRTMLDELQARRLGLFNELSQSDTEADRYSDLAARHRDIAAGIRQKIADLDKAISALTPEGKEALLESQPEPITTEVRKQDEQDAAGDWTNGGEDRLDAVCAELLAAPPPAQEAPAIPEGFIPWGGGEYLPVARGTPLVVLYRNGSEVDCTAGDEMSEFWHRSSTLVDHSPDHDIIAYRVIETGAPPSELDSSKIEGDDRVENLHDQPKLTDQQYDSLEPLPADKPSTVFLDQAQAAILDTNEDEPATSEQLEAAGIIDPAADDFAKGLLLETEAKAEPRKFGGIFSFGAKKTLVGEGV